MASSSYLVSRVNKNARDDINQWDEEMNVLIMLFVALLVALSILALVIYFLRQPFYKTVTVGEQGDYRTLHEACEFVASQEVASQEPAIYQPYQIILLPGIYTEFEQVTIPSFTMIVLERWATLANKVLHFKGQL